MLISPVLIIGIFSIASNKDSVMMNNGIDGVLRYLIPILGFVFISLGFLLFKKRLPGIIKDENENSKLTSYMLINVQRIACIEGIAIFSVVGFIYTLNNLYIAYTLIALAFYLPIYPTLKRIHNELDIKSNLIIEPNLKPKNTKSVFRITQMLLVPFFIMMIILNYNFFKQVTSNKVILPEIKIDNGVIKDNIYHNNYLDWTFNIPAGFKETPLSELERHEKQGNEALNVESDKNVKPIRLLNISDGVIFITSALNPRVLYPKLTDEDKYLETIENSYQNAKLNSVTFEKINQGTFLIDKTNFKYAEYSITGSEIVGMIFITKFNKDYILDIDVAYTDKQQSIEFLNNLKASNINWE
jgi:hypothetical protein